jgi:hypothetical protein
MGGLAEIIPDRSDNVGLQNLVTAKLFDTWLRSIACLLGDLHGLLCPSRPERSDMEQATNMCLWIAPRPSRIDYLRRIRASTAERNAARSVKNYALADQIRDELARHGTRIEGRWTRGYSVEEGGVNNPMYL